MAAPAFPFCSGPTILVDRTHGNFHQIEPISRELPGRYWGFARLLATDGYVVRDTDVPIASLLPTTEARVLVIANAQTGGTNPAEDAVGPADVAAIAAWVASGGSLLVIIDHRPFERVTSLLAAFGIDRLFDGNVPRHTFKRTFGDLNGASEIANGPDSSRAVATFTTFTGTAFSISATPPAGASYEPVLTLPSGVSGSSGSDSLDVGGLLQGVAIHFGSGRVYVAGEAGGLTVQTSIQGLRKNPGNEGLLRNILWWLTSSRRFRRTAATPAPTGSGTASASSSPGAAAHTNGIAWTMRAAAVALPPPARSPCSSSASIVSLSDGPADDAHAVRAAARRRSASRARCRRRCG